MVAAIIVVVKSNWISGDIRQEICVVLRAVLCDSRSVRVCVCVRVSVCVGVPLSLFSPGLANLLREYIVVVEFDTMFVLILMSIARCSSIPIRVQI